MKKLIIVILFISCSPPEFQKFTDESLINGRWYSPDNNETIIFDTDANTMSISGSGAIIDYNTTKLITSKFAIQFKDTIFNYDNFYLKPVLQKHQFLD